MEDKNTKEIDFTVPEAIKARIKKPFGVIEALEIIDLIEQFGREKFKQGYEYRQNQEEVMDYDNENSWRV